MFPHEQEARICWDGSRIFQGSALEVYGRVSEVEAFGHAQREHLTFGGTKIVAGAPDKVRRELVEYSLGRRVKYQSINVEKSWRCSYMTPQLMKGVARSFAMLQRHSNVIALSSSLHGGTCSIPWCPLVSYAHHQNNNHDASKRPIRVQASLARDIFTHWSGTFIDLSLIHI